MEAFEKRMLSSTSLALCLINSSCVPGHYLHVLWDMVTEILPAVLEDLITNLQQILHDGQNAAKYMSRSGLDTTDCLGRAVGTSVVPRRHT